MSESAPKKIRTIEDFVKQSPVLGTFFVLSFLNWFIFFAISMYLHGDALGTIPSRDGFVVTSHGHHTPVSQSVWAFSLFYSAATIMVTPAVWIASGVRMFGGQWSQGKWFARFAIPVFIAIWCLAWYSSIGGSFRRSVEDWRTLKRSNKPDAANPAMALQLTIEDHWRRVADLGRYAVETLFCRDETFPRWALVTV